MERERTGRVGKGVGATSGLVRREGDVRGITAAAAAWPDRTSAIGVVSMSITSLKMARDVAGSGLFCGWPMMASFNLVITQEWRG